MTTITIDPIQAAALGIDPADIEVMLPDSFEHWDRAAREAWAEAEIVNSTVAFWPELHGVDIEIVRTALGDDFRRFVRDQIKGMRREGADREP